MKWLGSVLVCCGGFWWWQLCLAERRRQQYTLELLLSALYQLREGIRMTRMPLPRLLEQAAEEVPFFGDVLQELRQNEELAAAWEKSAEGLPLSPQSGKVWRWLGGRLTGDESYVLQAMTYAERVLDGDRQQMESQKREVERRTTAMCFSATALVVILLL